MRRPFVTGFGTGDGTTLIRERRSIDLGDIELGQRQSAPTFQKNANGIQRKSRNEGTERVIVKTVRKGQYDSAVNQSHPGHFPETSFNVRQLLPERFFRVVMRFLVSYCVDFDGLDSNAFAVFSVNRQPPGAFRAKKSGGQGKLQIELSLLDF